MVVEYIIIRLDLHGSRKSEAPPTHLALCVMTEVTAPVVAGHEILPKEVVVKLRREFIA